jgi:hypothetical protein
LTAARAKLGLRNRKKRNRKKRWTHNKTGTEYMVGHSGDYVKCVRSYNALYKMQRVLTLDGGDCGYASGFGFGYGDGFGCGYGYVGGAGGDWFGDDWFENGY